MIYGNTADHGAGFYFQDCTPSLTNCVVFGNTAALQGGGIRCGFNSSAQIVNTVLWNNTAPAGPELYIANYAFPSSVSIRYSDVKGGQASAFVDSGCTLDWGAGMINAEPLFWDPANGDFHLCAGSPCCDGGDNSAASLPAFDYEGDERVMDGEWPPDSVPVVDIGADELVLLEAARFGNVNRAGGSHANILLVNGSAGGRDRAVAVAPGTPVSLSLDAPPAGPATSDFALYCILSECGVSHMADQPFSIGISAIPMPLSNGSPLPMPFTLANTIGFHTALGYPILQGISSAPCTIFDVPGMPGGTYTFQGILFDAGSAGPGLSVSNALVLIVD
jgi:hypothetical protein